MAASCSLLEPVDTSVSQEDKGMPQSGKEMGQGPEDMGVAQEDMAQVQDLMVADLPSEDMPTSMEDASSSLDLALGADMATPPWQPPGPVFYVSRQGDDSSDGSIDKPWRTFEHAMAQLAPQDTLFIRGGIYRASFKWPEGSKGGAPGRPIHIRAYQDEEVTLEESAYVSVELSGQSHIHFHGLRLENPTYAWLLVKDAKDVVFEDMVFNAPKPGKAYNAVEIRESQQVAIRNSKFNGWLREGGASCVSILPGNKHVVIEGNRFGDTQNSIIISGASENVIRNNEFDNSVGINLVVGARDRQDSDGVVQSERNLVEGNRFIRAGKGPQNSAFHVAERGVNSIYRFNQFYGAKDSAFVLAQYREKDQMEGVTFVHNTVTDNNTGNLAWRSGGAHVVENSSLTRNVSKVWFQNNVFFNNRPNSSGEPIDFATDFRDGGDPRDMKFIGNMLSPINSTCLDRISKGEDGQGQCPVTLFRKANNIATWFDGNFPDNFAKNKHADPAFTNPNGLEFRLSPESPAVDVAQPLTRTVNRGSGKTIPVGNVRFFHDGYGPLVEPDVIMVAGKRATIRLVDRTSNTITVLEELSWQEGDAVTYLYQGDGPDLGAIESH